MTYQNCEVLVRNDMGLDITKRTIQECFAMSKQIVVNEQDRRDYAAYERMNYLEFLEFIARISENWFLETELENLPLPNKIEEFLEQMLVLVDAKLVRQEIIIEQFSDSDEDY